MVRKASFALLATILWSATILPMTGGAAAAAPSAAAPAAATPCTNGISAGKEVSATVAIDAEGVCTVRVDGGH